MIVTAKVIAAAAAVKHEDIVEQVKKLFTKLSTDPTTASELVPKKQLFLLLPSSNCDIYVLYMFIACMLMDVTYA